MSTTTRKEMEVSIGTPGIKMVQYNVDIEGGKSVTLSAKDIGLSTIQYVDVKPAENDLGTLYISAIGTYVAGVHAGNYATISARRAGSTSTGVEAGTFQVFAIGI